MEESIKVIISGGGTGGHIFPAISIANAIKEQHPDAKILFVGAEGRMEMQRVPAAGYDIIGLPVAGFDRKNLLKNNQGSQNYQGLQARCSRGCGRICQRTDSEGGRNDGYPDLDSGTKLVCRRDQQAFGKAGA